MLMMQSLQNQHHHHHSPHGAFGYASDGSDGMHNFEDNTTPESVLLTMVQSYDWANTLARIASHPSETKVVGMQGRTPLHVACDHDAPAVVIQALLKAYPEASAMVGTSNMNPLHITCSSQHASVHVIRVLLEGGRPEQACMRDVDGDTALHAATRCGAPMEVLEVLLRANPAAVHERDYEGLTPLNRLWVRYFVILGRDAIEGVRGPADLHGEMGEAWKKTELLLRCAHSGSLELGPSGGSAGGGGGTGSGTVFRAVHAASAVDCPRQVVKIAAVCYPQQLGERDENGLTPLLIAAQAAIYKVRDLSDDGYMLEDVIHGDENAGGAEEQQHDDYYGEELFGEGGGAGAPGSGASSGGNPSVIEILLHVNQETAAAAAGVPDPLGRLPLHLALATGKLWNEGVKHLIQVYPEALTIPDVVSHLYAFMQAAEKGDLMTTFEILRFNPTFLADMAAAKNHHARRYKTQDSNSTCSMSDDATAGSEMSHNGGNKGEEETDSTEQINVTTSRTDYAVENNNTLGGHSKQPEQQQQQQQQQPEQQQQQQTHEEKKSSVP